MAAAIIASPIQPKHSAPAVPKEFAELVEECGDARYPNRRERRKARKS